MKPAINPERPISVHPPVDPSPTQIPESLPERMPFLDGIRGLAAVCVVCYHLTQNYNIHLFPTANLSVDLFFCLSGYVIAANYYDRISRGMSMDTYALKRIIRFYPMFIMGLLIGAVGIFLKYQAHLTNLNLTVILQSGLMNALFLPFLNDSTVVNFGAPTTGNIFPLATPYWSLSFEMFINIVFFYYVTRVSQQIKTILIGSAALYIVTSLLFGAENGWGSQNFIFGMPRVIFGFFAGVYVYLFISGKQNAAIVERARSSIRSNQRFYILGVCFFLIAVLSIDLHIGKFIRLIHVLCVLSFPIVIFVSALIQSKNIIVSKSMIFLGFISYPLYCLHYPIIHLVEGVNKLYHLNFGNLQVMGIVICLSAASSVLAALYIDEPARKYLTRLTFKDKPR